ncbi:phosphorylase [Wohlfahrtiimonas chitiniclastica]|uniref:phosphorylase family protein n=1 Tax=Wohlfahrtiimonas chitiniclastica TaxID=400946 RepID=UPI001BD115CD|nr:phosphorylase [Wohlfahrtiimonas chitiniclastica]MBS7827422.1 phosphorylase [Wohlfahrtiimonas chitiniclastica]
MVKQIDNCILLAGSISNATTDDKIDKAHAFVEILVTEVINSGGSFVGYFSAEPINANQKPLLFDWTIARKINQLIPNDSEKVYLKIVASNDRLQNKTNPEQRQLLNSMIARGIAEHICIDDEILTGSNVGEVQIEHATAMIALGGGKGVLDRAYKMAKKSLPVLPLDLQLGANKEDGMGALGILRKFRDTPLTYLQNTGLSVVKTISALTLEEPVLDFSQISKRIITIFHEEEQARLAALPPDVLVLTALPVELSAAKQALNICEDTQPFITSTELHVWKTVIIRNNGIRTNCAIASFAGPGNLDASSITSTLLSELQPKNVIMLGIAAGMREKCALGEVVLSERVVAYEGAALIEGDIIEHRPRSTELDMKVRQDVNTYLSNKNSVEKRLIQRYEALDIKFPESIEIGPIAKSIMPKTATIASGEKLLRDPEKFKALKEINGKIEVAEMEGAGVFVACANHKKTVLMIRGISDFGDSTKDNRFHDLAAKAAAAVTADYIAHGLTLNN